MPFDFLKRNQTGVTDAGAAAWTGPGGGEPAGAQIESRFRPTAEMFIDPTTGQQMRVLIDPANGERRYIAEG